VIFQEDILSVEVTAKISNSQHKEQVEGGDSASLPRSAETPPGVLCPALEPSAQGRPGAVAVGPEEAPVMIRGLEPSAVRKSWESWGCSAWRGEGSRETLEQLPVPGGVCKKAGEELYTRPWSDRTRGNGFKLKEGRFRLDIKKKIITMRVVRPWPRLPREAVAAPSLAVLKARLDGALSTLGWWKGSLPMAGGLEPDDL